MLAENMPIDKYDMSACLLKMWMENIVTDSEYYHIVDKLNEWGEKQEEIVKEFDI